MNLTSSDNDINKSARTPRTIVIGDIHGCYSKAEVLISELQEKGKYIPESDRLIFIGDYIDRGDNPRLAVRYVRGLQDKYGDNIIPLKGNHEDMLLDYMVNDGQSWLFNGYEATLSSYKGFDEEFIDDMRWMADLPLYYEDDYYIYVHAGVDKGKPMDAQFDHTLLWTRREFFNDPRPYSKKIIFGHTPTLIFDGGYTPLWLNDGNDIAIDTGCVYGGKLTALIIEKDQVIEFCQI